MTLTFKKIKFKRPTKTMRSMCSLWAWMIQEGGRYCLMPKGYKLRFNMDYIISCYQKASGIKTKASKERKIYISSKLDSEGLQKIGISPGNYKIYWNNRNESGIQCCAENKGGEFSFK